MLIFRSEAKMNLEKYFVSFEEEDSKVAAVINDTILYFVTRANRNQYAFYILNILLLLINSFVLVINQLEFDRIIITIFTSVATFIAALIALFRYADNWRRFRANAEKLKMECLLFSSSGGEYAKKTTAKEKEQLLVDNFKEICCEDMRELNDILDKIRASLEPDPPKTKALSFTNK